MLQSAVRSAPRRILASRLPLKPSSTRRFLSTAPPAQKSRSWKSSAARWALAAGGLYYYNTSSIFAEQPDEAISRLDQSLHNIQESSSPTIDAIVAEKRQRQAESQMEEAQVASPEAKAVEDEGEGPGSVQDLEEEADQQGAFNPETGEINWDCPCLGGMAHGPCGEEFRAAFSCFVYSKEEPKGMECIDKFKGMQDCFRQHPEMYGSELEDDEDEVEEELHARTSASGSEDSSEAPTSSPIYSQSPRAASGKDPEPSSPPKVTVAQAGPSKLSGEEGGDLVPRAAADATAASR